LECYVLEVDWLLVIR